jgi:hypothetical protein
MIWDMADWEQPSTSLSASGGDDNIEALREELAAAFQRIIALETRLQELEDEVRTRRGLASGA